LKKERKSTKVYIMLSFKKTSIAITVLTSTLIAGDTQTTSPKVCKQALSYTAEADFLYWYVQDNGNEFAQTGQVLNSVDPLQTFNSGKIYSPSYQASPGFKVGFSVTSPDKEYDIGLLYTWMHSSASKSITSEDPYTGILPQLGYNPAGSVIGNCTFSGGGNYINQAQANWRIHFNAFDFDLGRIIKIKENVVIKPIIGLKGIYETQVFNFNFDTYDDTLGTYSYQGSNYNHNTQSLWGAGLKTGFKSYWSFVKNFGLFFDVAIDLLYGAYKSKINSSDLNNPGQSPEDYTIAIQTLSNNSFFPVVELFGGLTYDIGDCLELRKFQLKLGWEEQIWFFNNQHASPTADNSLILQGLTAKFAYSF
jgi:hypothetical protein